MTLSAAGVLSVPAANITGTLTAGQISVSTLSAISANMGTLTAGTISYGTVGSNESFYLSNTNKTATVAGASRTNLRLSVGSGFGVDKDGKLYATGAIISGALTATSLTINSGATIGGDGASQILNSEIEVGGRNLARGTATMIKGNGNWNTGTWRDSGASNTYNYTVNDSPVPSVDKGILVTTATAKTRYGVAQDGCPMLSKQLTFSVWAKGTSGGTITLQSVWWNGISVSNWSKAFTANGSWQYFSFTTDLTNVTIPNNACSICYMYWTGVNANDSCIFIAPKLEYGNKATDWSPAPEDVQANIDAKKSVHTIQALNSSGTQYTDTYASLLNYSTEGRTGLGCRVASIDGIKIGDTVRLAFVASDMNNAVVYIIGTVTNTTLGSYPSLYWTSHGLDTTVIDGGHILTGTIDANKVNISNLTVGAMSAEAAKSILNHDNLFGYGSQCEALNGFENSGFEIVEEDGYKCAHASGALTTSKYFYSKIPFTPKAKETVTISAYVKIKNIVYGTTNPMCEFYINGQTISGTWRSATVDAVYVDGVSVTPNGLRFPTYISDTNWHHIAIVRTWENFTFTNNLSPAVYFRDCTGDLYVRNVKYERGNTYTDWSPAPGDLETQWEIPSSLIANENSTYCTMSLSGNNITITRLTAGSSYGCYYDMPCKPNTFYSASIRVISGSDFNINFGGDYGSGSVWSGMGVSHRRTSNGKQYAATAKATSSTQSYLRIYICSNVQNATMTFTDLTVYEGDDIGLLDRSAYNASLVATNYVTQIDSNGIWVTPSGKKPNTDGSPVTSGSSATTGTKIDGTGVWIYNAGKPTAQYGSTTTFYKSDGTTPAATIGANGIDLKAGGTLGGWTINQSSLRRTQTQSSGIVDDISLTADGVLLDRDYSNSSYASANDHGYVQLSPSGFEATLQLQDVVIYHTSVTATYIDTPELQIKSHTPIVIETKTVDNITINANSIYTWDNTNVTKTDYKLAGIVGWSVANATSSGSNSSLCNVYYCQVTGTSSFSMIVRNAGSASSASANSYGNAKVKLSVNLLWIATGLI